MSLPCTIGTVHNNIYQCNQEITSEGNYQLCRYLKIREIARSETLPDPVAMHPKSKLRYVSRDKIFFFMENIFHPFNSKLMKGDGQSRASSRSYGSVPNRSQLIFLEDGERVEPVLVRQEDRAGPGVDAAHHRQLAAQSRLRTRVPDEHLRV
jgi:hypothetical protein